METKEVRRLETTNFDIVGPQLVITRVDEAAGAGC